MDGKKQLRIAALSLLLLTCARTRADGLKIAAVGTLNFSSPRINAGSGSLSTSSSLGLGFGGLADFPLVPSWRLESGILYITDAFSQSTTSYNMNHFQIPVVVRYTLFPFLSVGAGGYYSFAVNGIAVGNASTTNNVSYDSLNLSSSDYGAVFSAALDLTVGPSTTLLVDMRYVWGFKNLSNVNGQTFRLGGFLFLAGLKFGLL